MKVLKFRGINMLFLTVFLLLIIPGYPIWDYFYMKKIKGGIVNKWRMYSEIMITQWVMAMIALVFWLTSKRSIKGLFHLDKPLFSVQPDVLLGLGFGVGTCIVGFGLIFAFSKTKREKVFDAIKDESIQFLLPSSLGERLLFLFIALTAGFCEELIFRGVMLYYLKHVPFDLPIIAIVIISSLFFGIVHLYQGWKGVLFTTYLGAILFLLYIGTGYLWIPITIHILIDAKFVFLPSKNGR